MGQGIKTGETDLRGTKLRRKFPGQLCWDKSCLVIMVKILVFLWYPTAESWTRVDSKRAKQRISATADLVWRLGAYGQRSAQSRELEPEAREAFCA